LNGTGSVDFYGKQRFEVYGKSSLEENKRDADFCVESSKPSEESAQNIVDSQKITNKKVENLLEKKGMLEVINDGLKAAKDTYNSIKLEIKAEAEKAPIKIDYKELSNKINEQINNLQDKLEKASFNGVKPFCPDDKKTASKNDIIEELDEVKKSTEGIGNLSINEQNSQTALKAIDKKLETIQKNKDKTEELMQETENQINTLSKDKSELNRSSGENLKKDAVKEIMNKPEEATKIQVKTLESDVILALINVLN